VAPLLFFEKEKKIKYWIMGFCEGKKGSFEKKSGMEDLDGWVSGQLS